MDFQPNPAQTLTGSGEKPQQQPTAPLVPMQNSTYPIFPPIPGFNFVPTVAIPNFKRQPQPQPVQVQPQQTEMQTPQPQQLMQPQPVTPMMQMAPQPQQTMPHPLQGQQQHQTGGDGVWNQKPTGFMQQIDMVQEQSLNNLVTPNDVLGNSNIASRPEDPKVDYYQETCKLYIANVVLTTQLKELVAEKNELLARLHKMEKKLADQSNDALGMSRKRRHRRPANEIERPYKCPYQNCGKAYGSEGSLTQHIKLKHPEFYVQITTNSQAKARMLQMAIKPISKSQCIPVPQPQYQGMQQFQQQQYPQQGQLQGLSLDPTMQ